MLPPNETLDFPAVIPILYQRRCGKTLFSPHFMRLFSNRNQKSPQNALFLALVGSENPVFSGDAAFLGGLKSRSPHGIMNARRLDL
jgi:hypothetical protein